MSGLQPVGNGIYQYRGVAVFLNDRVGVGEPGRWVAHSDGQPYDAFATLKAATVAIDARRTAARPAWDTALNRELIIRVGIQLPDLTAVLGAERLTELFDAQPNGEAVVDGIDFDDPAFDHLFPSE